MINKILFEVMVRLIVDIISTWAQWWPLVPMPF